MRAKHHYTIKKIVYTYHDDYPSFNYTTKEVIMFQTNKRAKAESFYHSHLWEEEDNGTEYKGCYYPNIEIRFHKDY